MASNEVHAFQKARDAAKEAEKAGASQEDIKILQAAAAAKKALTPGGRGMD